MRENVDGLDGVTFVHADIGDTDVVAGLLETHGVDVIVNFAAESHNSLAVLDPARFFRTNVVGTQGLCEAARRVGVRRFHHVSTCEVYGDLALDSTEAFTEESPYRPRTPYNASKAGGDHVVRAYHETWALPVTITNCANNYGPYQFPEKVIPYFTTLALRDEPLPMYASTQNRREWIHAVDHCRAIDVILERGRVGETYHVGTGVERSIEEIADTVLGRLGKPASLKTIVPDRPGHDRRYVLDWSKIRGELGWEPRIDWDTGIAETIDWYAGHPEWWEPLRDRAPVAETTAWSGAADVRLLVTGAGGQLGHDLVRVAAAAGDDVVGADHATLDVTDRDAVLGAITTWRPDAVVHGAAWTAVDACEGDPERAFTANALAVRWVAEAAIASAPTSCTCRPTTSSTARWTGPTTSGTGPTPSRCTGRPSWQARGRRSPSAPTPRSSARRGCAARTGRTSSRRCSGRPARSSPAGWRSSTTSAGARRSPPTSRRCCGGSPSTAAPDCTT